MRYTIKIILLFFVGFLPSWALAGDSIRVQVLSKYPLSEVRVSADAGPLNEAPVNIQNRDGLLHVRSAQVDRVTPRFAVKVPAGNFLNVEGGGGVRRRFSGRLIISSRAGSLFIINEIPLEVYVSGVLASEMPAETPFEALKAQAILVRTYAAHPRHREADFDFCDLTHCQAFAGPTAAPVYLAAAGATRSMILSYQGKPVEALYHSTCGGHTSANQKVFGGQALAYLQGVQDGDYCAASPHSSWISRFPLKQIPQNSQADPIREILPLERETGGRWFSLELVGSRRVDMPVERFLSELGKKIGWNQVKSNWFEVRVEVEDAVFTGRGLGHGVGFCQWGAAGMAREGKKSDQILRHYFPGTNIRKM